MKKFLLLAACLALGFTIYSCQDDKTEFLDNQGAITRSEIKETEVIDYYWYREKKIPIKQVDNKSFVIFKSSDKDALLQSLSTQNVKFNPSSIKLYTHGGIDLTNGNNTESFMKGYESIEIFTNPSEAIKFDEVIYAAPFYHTSDDTKFPLTNLFYVFLKNTGDYTLLEKKAKEVNANIISRYEEFPDMYVLSCTKDSKGNALEIANLFYETGLFKDTEPSFMSFTLESSPNDPFYGNQWNLYHTDSQGNYIGYDIRYQQAYDAGIIPNASNIIAAVTDSGVDLSHPDLTLHSFSWDATYSSSPSVVWDGHGTTVAGVIGATSNNNISIAGVASGVKIMSLSCNFSEDGAPAAEMASLILKAVNHGAHVINNSWSTGVYSPVIASAIDQAVTIGRDGKGCVMVFPSGNYDTDTAQISSLLFPASYTPENKVIAVGAISQDGKRKKMTFLSSWGSHYGTNLDIVTPGELIYTTIPVNGIYTTTSVFDGTSLSAAHVSGVASLIIAKNPTLTYDEVGYIIAITANKSLNGYTFSNTTKIGGTWNKYVGHGLLNMYDALQMAQSTSYPNSGTVAITGGQTNLNSGGSGYVGSTFVATPTNNNYKYFWSGSYSGTCDRWYVTPNTAYGATGNISVYLNSGQSGALTVTCRVFNGSTFVGSATKTVYVSY